MIETGQILNICVDRPAGRVRISFPILVFWLLGACTAGDLSWLLKFKNERAFWQAKTSQNVLKSAWKCPQNVPLV
jgi:hypothetical protein